MHAQYFEWERSREGSVHFSVDTPHCLTVSSWGVNNMSHNGLIYIYMDSSVCLCRNEMLGCMTFKMTNIVGPNKVMCAWLSRWQILWGQISYNCPFTFTCHSEVERNLPRCKLSIFHTTGSPAKHHCGSACVGVWVSMWKIVDHQLYSGSGLVAM